MARRDRQERASVRDAGRRPHRVVKGGNGVEGFDVGAREQEIKRFQVGASFGHRHRSRAHAETDQRTEDVVVSRRFDRDGFALPGEQTNGEGNALARSVTKDNTIGFNFDPDLA